MPTTITKAKIPLGGADIDVDIHSTGGKLVGWYAVNNNGYPLEFAPSEVDAITAAAQAKIPPYTITSTITIRDVEHDVEIDHEAGVLQAWRITSGPLRSTDLDDLEFTLVEGAVAGKIPPYTPPPYIPEPGEIRDEDDDGA